MKYGKKGRFSSAEDQKLIQLVSILRFNQWKEIGGFPPEISLRQLKDR
jgi:hypothetical protein